MLKKQRTKTQAIQQSDKKRTKQRFQTCNKGPIV